MGDIDVDHKHEKSYIVELSGRIWPADMAIPCSGSPQPKLTSRKFDDEACSHALFNEIGWIECAGD
jgi:hypothetical protein